MNLIKILRTESRIKLSGFISGFILIFLLAWTVFPASAVGIEASRGVSVGKFYPGDSFTVTIHIKADDDVEALTLDEDLPDGWKINQWEDNGSVFQNTSTFKPSTQEWIWTENLLVEEEKIVVYNVTVPANSKPGNFTISGRISAYSVSATPVGGSSEVTVISLPAEANFSANPLTGSAPLTVQFTDLSTFSPDSWEWDFDGNGNIDSNERNPIYTYETPGNYTVILKASNSTYENNTTSKTGYIIVTDKPSISVESGEHVESIESDGSSGGGSGGRSGSSGGGSTSSPEITNNIVLKEISNEQVFKGIHTCFTFKDEINEIVSLEFDPKKNFGKTTAIIEMLKNTSSMVPEPAPGKVYKNVNIWVGNSGFSSSKNLENAKINFRVNKSWVSENNINESTVTLYRYSQDSWNSLPTTFSGEDNNYLYFTAETPGFSPFAISGTETKSQSIKISSSRSGENQTSNEEKTSTDEKKEVSTPNIEKKDKKSVPGFEIAIVSVELLIVSRILKKKR